MNNLAEVAHGRVEEDDCTLMNHFLDQGETELTIKSPTACMTFGYFYTSTNAYYCTHYGHVTGCGVKPGYDNNNEGRRVICPCYQIQNSTMIFIHATKAIFIRYIVLDMTNIR